MRMSRFTDEQIVTIVREAESGARATEVCRRHGVRKETLRRWRVKGPVDTAGWRSKRPKLVQRAGLVRNWSDTRSSWESRQSGLNMVPLSPNGVHDVAGADPAVPLASVTQKPDNHFWLPGLHVPGLWRPSRRHWLWSAASTPPGVSPHACEPS
jgi:putative transposase